MIGLTGNEAVALGVKQSKPNVISAYPITPQTKIVEKISEYIGKKELDAELILVESEHSALSAAIGASAAGARVYSATSSQGLALMNEICYIASGLRLPIVMTICTRALSAPINIHCDHSDIYSIRDAGWITIFTKNVQEAYDFSIMSFKIAETCNYPTAFTLDGFIISHSVEPLDILNTEDVIKFVGEQRKNILYSLEKDITIGPLALQDSYMDFKYYQQKELLNTTPKIKDIFKEFEKHTGRQYKTVEYYNKDAKNVIICLGSVYGTIKYYLEKNKIKNWGIIYPRLFRPFPERDIIKLIQDKEQIIVLDRGISFGSKGPLYLEISSRLDTKDIKNVIYGLGGRDFSLDHVKKILNLKEKVKWLL